MLVEEAEQLLACLLPDELFLGGWSLVLKGNLERCGQLRAPVPANFVVLRRNAYGDFVQPTLGPSAPRVVALEALVRREQNVLPCVVAVR
nr:hypothetical protein [Chondromyces crocatus]